MSGLRASKSVLPFVLLAMLGGCAGGLLGSGGKPNELYRFGTLERSDAVDQPPQALRTLALERVHFAPEIDSDRILAVHAGTARYIKGSRWVTAAPSLFEQAVVQSFQFRAPGFRITTGQRSEHTGYSLVIYVRRFEAHYEDASMALPPVIAIEGDATLYSLADRLVMSQRHFLIHDAAKQNRAVEIAAAFDRATIGFTTDVVDWVSALDAIQRPQSP